MLVIGAAGSMGRRYRAILNSLNIPFRSYDLVEYDSKYKLETKIKTIDWHNCGNSSRAIICTPSRSHSVVTDELQELGVDSFLIEKPMFDCAEDYQWGRNQSADLRMVCNYKFIDGKDGPTLYNYYDAGREDPWMNYFQIIGMARGSLEIYDDSPVWLCILNGRRLTLAEIHESYVLMIQEWMRNRENLVGLEEAFEWFQKSQKWASEYKVGSHLDASRIKFSMNSGTIEPSSTNVSANV